MSNAGGAVGVGQAARAIPLGARAGFWRRFAAMLIDGVLISAATALIVATDASDVVAAIAAVVVAWAYWVGLEGGSRGQTLGKMALGIRVADKDTGGPIGYGRAFVRRIVAIVSAVVIYIGYLWMLWDPEKQTWHDKAVNAVVVPRATA
jgi:uncharacterized RDD family membrane protein YckC